MKRFFLSVIAFFVIVIVSIVLLVMTTDPNKYRANIAEILSRKIGRSVTLAGPVSLHLSVNGIAFSVGNVSIGNPSWASRPEMASVGEFDLGVEVLPLFHHKLVVKNLKISKANIQLEKRDNGQVNWILNEGPGKPGTSVKTRASTQALSSDEEGAVAVDVGEVQIEDSRLTFVNKGGAFTLFKIEKLMIQHEASGFSIRMTSDFNETPIALSITTGIDNLMALHAFPLAVDVSYANFHVLGVGTIDIQGRNLDFSSLKVTAGKSEIHGTLSVKWGGVNPLINADISSADFATDDFKPETHRGVQGTYEDVPQKAVVPSVVTHENAAPSTDETIPYVMSSSPLAFESLRGADAHINLKFDQVEAGGSTFQKVDGVVVLTAGQLKVDFPTIKFCNGAIDLKAVVESAASSAKVELSLAARDLEMSELMPLLGMKPFIKAKMDATVNVMSVGNSMHELASHAEGTLNVLSNGGSISTAELSQVNADLARLVSLSSPSEEVPFNCLALRYLVKDGFVTDNGVLVDTAFTTLAIKGGLNLSDESFNMMVVGKPKAAKVAGKIDGLLPSVHIGGTMARPKFNVTAEPLVAGLTNFLNGSSPSASGVPTVSAPPGQNACLYTLDHPLAVPAPQPSPSHKATDNIKAIGNKLIKSFFEH